MNVSRFTRQFDVGIDESVVDARQKPLAKAFPCLQLETLVRRAHRILIGRPELGGGLYSTLDGIGEVLIKEAGGNHLGRARKPLPSDVVIPDEGPSEIGITHDGTSTDHVGKFEIRQLTKLGTIDGVAQPAAEVHAVVQSIDQTEAGKNIGIVESDWIGVKLRVEQIEAGNVLLRFLHPDTADETPIIGKRKIDHPVCREDLLVRRVGVRCPRFLLQLEIGPEVLLREELLRRLGQIHADGITRKNRKRREAKSLSRYETAGPNLNMVGNPFHWVVKMLQSKAKSYT